MKKLKFFSMEDGLAVDFCVVDLMIMNVSSGTVPTSTTDLLISRWSIEQYITFLYYIHILVFQILLLKVRFISTDSGKLTLYRRS